MQRFACVPSFVSDAFFKQKDKLEQAMCLHNPIDSFKRVEPSFEPKDGVRYYLHADLAQKHDKCAIAISHVDKWVEIRTFNDHTQIHPFVIVDAIVWWEPRKEGPVNLSEVKNWIVDFRRQGFQIGLVTFDRWQSFDIQQELKSVGIKTDTLSVGKKHYEDLAMLVYEDRVLMPHNDILLEEMSQLRIVSDKKVDHPRKGSKDLSDAVTGAVYNAIAHTPRNLNQEISVHSWKSLSKNQEKERSENLIVPPRAPEEVKEFLSNMGFM
jgi:phage terminase large subunit-like protein